MAENTKIINDEMFGALFVTLTEFGNVEIADADSMVEVGAESVAELAAVLFEIARATAGVETIDGRTVIDVELPPLALGRAPAPEVSPEWRERTQRDARETSTYGLGDAGK
jgi:hypothetical protein